MAKRRSDEVKVGISSSSGSSVIVDLSQYVDTIGEVSIDPMVNETHTFGDSWVERTYTGVRGTSPIVIEGYYDDAAASGPHALLGNATDMGSERNFEIDFGASDVVNGKVILTGYNRLPKRGELTRYRSTWTPTGALGSPT